MPWVLAAVHEVLAGAAGERVLDRALRRAGPLDASVRRAAAEAVFGVGLWRRRLAHHVGRERPQPAELLFSLLADLGGVERTRAAELLGLDATRYPVRPPPAELALCHSLPDWLAATFEAELGLDAGAFCAALNEPGPITLRANLLKTDSAELADELRCQGVVTRPTTYAREGLVVTSPRPNLLGLDAHRAGRFEVQDEGSQLLGTLVGARPGERILDLCAGAGGKTLQLASETRDQAQVLAFDVDEARLERLRLRAARAGAASIRVAGVPPAADDRFDRVLVDAPCSELGALRRGPDLRFRLRPDDFASLPTVQLELLERALTYLVPGGTLVYATCTLRREENEDVARAFESKHPEAARVRPGEGWLAESFLHQGYFRSLPHVHGTDAFFAAVYRRR